jgi:hypothetical protein
MDQISDFGKFQRLMRRLCETMNKPITDELVETWWKSLRAVQFAEVERRMESFMERAGENTRFPRPGMMRPEDAPATDVRDAARDQRMSEDNRRNWLTFLADFPKTGPIRKKMAECSRIMVATHESSAAYAEAQSEYFALERQLGPLGRFARDA